MAVIVVTKNRIADDTAPLSLAQGELAVNLFNNKLYVGPESGGVGVELLGAPVNEGGAIDETLRWDESTGRWVSNDTLIVTDAGLVGINIAAPLAKLHILETTTSGATPNTSANALVLEEAGVVGMSLLTANDSEGRIWFGDPESNGAGQLNYVHDVDAMRFYTANSEQMRLTNFGKLMLGEEPGGCGGFQDGLINLTYDNVNDTTFEGINFVTDNSAGRCFINYRREGASTTGRLIFGTSDTERMFIDPTGDVVINSVDNDFDGNGHKLAVESSGHAAGFYRVNATATSGLVDYYSDFGGVETQVAQTRVDGTYLGPISDVTIKSNIAPATVGLAELMNLDTIEYDVGGDHFDIGFSAQNIQANIPQAVAEVGGLLARVDSHLLPVVVKALQEVVVRLEALEAI